MTPAHDDLGGAEHQFENPDDAQSGGGAVTITGCGLLVAFLVALGFMVWAGARAVMG